MFNRLRYPLTLLLLAALAIACWARSYAQVDILYYQPNYDQGNSPDIQYHLRIDKGLLRFGVQNGIEEAWMGKFGHASITPAISPFPFFHWEHTAACNGIPDTHFSDFTLLGLGYRHYASRSVDPRLHWWDISLPLWLLTAIPLARALPPLVRALRHHRRRHLLAQNLCPTCHYDLRAHLQQGPNSVPSTQSSSLPRRCPECGTPIPFPPLPDPTPPASLT